MGQRESGRRVADTRLTKHGRDFLEALAVVQQLFNPCYDSAIAIKTLCDAEVVLCMGGNLHAANSWKVAFRLAHASGAERSWVLVAPAHEVIWPLQDSVVLNDADLRWQAIHRSSMGTLQDLSPPFCPSPGEGVRRKESGRWQLCPLPGAAPFCGACGRLEPPACLPLQNPAHPGS